jgi:hypothetical protein
VHVPQLCRLDGVVGIKGVKDQMVTVIVSIPCYLHFVSYALTLTTFYAISLHRRWLSSCILPWICSGILLDIGNITCNVGNVASGVGCNIGQSVSCRISWSISCNISGGIGGLHHLVFTSSLFSHRLKRTMATASLARMFQSAPGVGTCC